MRLRRLDTAYLRQGNPLPLVGLVLADYQRKGAPVLLDAESGEELADDADPFFVLSTPFEASDRHILRQIWDVSRGIEAGGPGVPVLFNHSPGRSPSEVYGQWRDLGVRSDVPFNDGSSGDALLGRPSFDLEDAEAVKLRGKVRRGIIPAVSVRWTPGERVRRGDLDPEDPLYREPHNDACDEPAEGYVMGSERDANHLIEVSFTPIPADQRAVRRAATMARATADLERGLRTGLLDEQGLQRLLTVLGDDARVLRWARAQVATAAPDLFLEAFQALPLDERRALVGLDPLPAAPPPARTIADLLRSAS